MSGRASGGSPVVKRPTSVMIVPIISKVNQRQNNLEKLLFNTAWSVTGNETVGSYPIQQSVQKMSVYVCSKSRFALLQGGFNSLQEEIRKHMNILNDARWICVSFAPRDRKIFVGNGRERSLRGEGRPINIAVQKERFRMEALLSLYSVYCRPSSVATFSRSSSYRTSSCSIL